MRTPGRTLDWLYHHLTASGPADGVAAFAAVARGAGVTPWQLDFASLEDDLFVRAVAQPASQRTLSVAGCRILARQLRARVGHSRACPLLLSSDGDDDLIKLPLVAAAWGSPVDTAGEFAAGFQARLADRLV